MAPLQQRQSCHLGRSRSTWERQLEAGLLWPAPRRQHMTARVHGFLQTMWDIWKEFLVLAWPTSGACRHQGNDWYREHTLRTSSLDKWMWWQQNGLEKGDGIRGSGADSS